MRGGVPGKRALGAYMLTDGYFRRLTAGAVLLGKTRRILQYGVI